MEKTQEIKLKVYCVSILAIKSAVNENDFILDSASWHIPALIPAESITDAAEACRTVAFQNWPPSDGFHSHQAMIQPVTRQFFHLALNALETGVIDEAEDEQEQTFSFDPTSPGATATANPSSNVKDLPS